MKVAHISDLHVLDMAGVPFTRFLNKRATGWANLKLKREHKHRTSHVGELLREIRRIDIDHVVITGDLTNLALETEFVAVKRLLERELALAPENVSVVPGNHDLYTRGSMVTRRFVTTFSEYVRSDLPELAHTLPLGPFPFVRLRGPLALIGLSSAVPRLPLVAAGVLGRGQREALARILAHDEVRRRTPVILVHHPPHHPERLAKAIVEGLHDAGPLVRGLAAERRAYLLHGHLHRRMHTPLGGGIVSFGATSASLEHEDPDRMAGINLYAFDDATGALSSASCRVLDSRARTFETRALPLTTWL
jgi:3',5'-cyclic AMP phosphodiesterase CpdA